MIKRILNIECPACKTKIKRKDLLRTSKKEWWKLIRAEYGCPLCKSEMVMCKASLVRLYFIFHFFILFFVAHVILRFILDKYNFQALDNLGNIILIFWLVYLVYAICSVKFFQKKQI